MININALLKSYKITSDRVKNFGTKSAKIICTFSTLKKTKNKKLILVTSLSPTPSGEGKTTTAIGLSDALNKNKKTIVCLRQPSIGPTLGCKGGATGFKRSAIVPEQLINYGLNGDFFKIETIHNLISSMIDNHVYYQNKLKINPKKITWRRVVDISDRSLRNIPICIDKKKKISYNGGFDITASSEIMAILCLSKNWSDFIKRVNNIIVAYNFKNQPVYVKDFKITNTIKILSSDLLYPNAVKTKENTLCLMHGGPFSNIAHGCSSVISLNLGFKYAEYVVTECGFGSDLGFEKFMDIVSPLSFKPDCVLLCISLKSILYHNQNNKIGKKSDQISNGLRMLNQHINLITSFGIKPIIAINKFHDDNKKLLEILVNWIKKNRIKYSFCSPESGSSSFKQLSELVINQCNQKNNLKKIYKNDQNLKKKINIVVHNVYGLKSDVIFSKLAKEKLNKYKNLNYPVCFAKTPYSFSSDPKKLVYNPNDKLIIDDILLANGAKLIILICGKIYRMPGLPKKPNAEN